MAANRQSEWSRTTSLRTRVIRAPVSVAIVEPFDPQFAVRLQQSKIEPIRPRRAVAVTWGRPITPRWSPYVGQMAVPDFADQLRLGTTCASGERTPRATKEKPDRNSTRKTD